MAWKSIKKQYREILLLVLLSFSRSSLKENHLPF
jgi:hypothetical protein